MTAQTLSGRARDYLKWAQANPAAWCERELGVELWSMQAEILESVRANERTSVRSCHGPGKTVIAANTVLWFAYNFPEAAVVTTATTWKQIEKMMWREVHRIYRGSPRNLGGLLLKTELKLPGGRGAWGLSTAPGQQDSFQGLHSPHVLFIADEAAGVPEIIYEQAESYMATGQGRMLLIGNPTTNSGEFYRSHHGARDQYQTFHIGYADTPNFTGEAVSDELKSRLVSRAWVDGRRKAWGEDSPEFQIRCEGNFSTKADNTVMSLALVEAAQARVIPDTLISVGDEKVISCDVARFGNDETTIFYREGRRIRMLEAYRGFDTMQTTGHLVRYAKDLNADRVVVDDTGVGGGVTDRLKELGIRTQAFIAGGSAVEKDHYENARAELWFVARDELADCDMPDDPMLAADLVAPIYKMTSAGKRKLEPKDDTKKRLGRSPDRGDGLCMLFAPVNEPVMEIW